MTRPAALAVAALLATGCIPENGPMMEPGHDCLECHGGGGGEDDAVAWTVAGTVGDQGSKVWIQDATGRSFTLNVNQAGNFYTREPVTFPIRVSVDGEPMPPEQGIPGSGSFGLLSPPNNSCNRSTSCHGGGGGGGGD
jgi:hypothetical protein